MNAQQLAEYMQTFYPQMLSFAQNQLGDKSVAEDLIQETFISASQHLEGFKNNAALKSWVFAILKHKIIDHIRKHSKTTTFSQLLTEQDDEDNTLLETLFDHTGHWYKETTPKAFDHSWQNPELQQQQQDFWSILETCLTNLPQEQARAFLMKSYIELDTQEICHHMCITQQKFYVLIHRARLRLQECLNLRWFN